MISQNTQNSFVVDERKQQYTAFDQMLFKFEYHKELMFTKSK